MALQTTAILSVLLVALSIVAHQSDPEIIPSLLAQGMDTLKTINKTINEYYTTYFSVVYKTFVLDTLWPHKQDSKFIKTEENNKSKKPSKVGPNKDILLTKEELKDYDGTKNSKGIYVAILGSVFDVESGRKHYGPGGSYNFFAGIDGSRAFITGEFSEAGLVDDVSGLTPKDLKSLHDWVGFYHKDYKYIGKLIGRFYDSNGKPTADLKSLMKAVKRFEREEAMTKEEHKTYPPCNVEWNKEKGSRVWCTTKSGGVVRDWAGVPRQLFEGSGKKNRCTCVEPKSAVSDPRLAEYEGCPPGADSCWVREL